MTGQDSDCRDRPILVTGCPRSGTTWVGQVIGASPDVFYVYEPFNDDIGAHLRMPERFMALTSDTAEPFQQRISEIVSLGRFGPRCGLAVLGVAERWRPADRRTTAARLAARRLLRHRQGFIHPRRVCIKDPLAFYASEWMADRFGAQVVMLVRHPGGVVASYLGLGWKSEFAAIADRPVPPGAERLARDIAAYRAGPADHLSELILQWRIFTTCTLDLQRRRPNWIFALHEDISAHPKACFDEMFARLGIDMSEEIATKIARETSGDGGAPVRQHNHQRDSRALANAWRTKLAPATVDRILNETGDLWQEVGDQIVALSP